MLASKMQIAAKRCLALVMLLDFACFFFCSSSLWGWGVKGPLFANYLYSCFVPFRHSQLLVEWVALALGRQSRYKVQAEVTSAGRHIIYVISVLNYLHRKYGRLTSASTATVGDVLHAVASSGHAELSVSPIVRPDSYDVFFLILFFSSFRFSLLFGLLIFLGFLCYCCRFRLGGGQ